MNRRIDRTAIASSRFAKLCTASDARLYALLQLLWEHDQNTCYAYVLRSSYTPVTRWLLTWLILSAGLTARGIKDGRTLVATMLLLRPCESLPICWLYIADRSNNSMVIVITITQWPAITRNINRKLQTKTQHGEITWNWTKNWSSTPPIWPRLTKTITHDCPTVRREPDLLTDPSL